MSSGHDDENGGSATSIRLSEDLRSRLAKHAGNLTATSGRRASMAQALEDLLERAEHQQRSEGTAVRSKVTAPNATGEEPASTITTTSQTVTEADIAAGQIRFPSAAKRVFPSRRCDIVISLRGVTLAARWDPRFGPDRERSGVLRIGRENLQRLVEPNSQLTVTPLLHLD